MHRASGNLALRKAKHVHNRKSHWHCPVRQDLNSNPRGVFVKFMTRKHKISYGKKKSPYRNEHSNKRRAYPSGSKLSEDEKIIAKTSTNR